MTKRGGFVAGEGCPYPGVPSTISVISQNRTKLLNT